METLYNYIIDNYTIDGTTRRIIDSLLLYVFDNLTNSSGLLTDAGADFLTEIIADNIGADRAEMIDN